MIFKTVGQPLGNIKRVLESHWEMPEGYWKDSRQFSNQLGNAQIPTASQEARRQKYQAAFGKNVVISIHFL
jgi:hypothetical protein